MIPIKISELDLTGIMFTQFCGVDPHPESMILNMLERSIKPSDKVLQLIPNVSPVLQESVVKLKFYCGERNWHFDPVRLNLFQNLTEVFVKTISCIAIDVMAALSDVNRATPIQRLTFTDTGDPYTVHYPYDEDIVRRIYICLPGLKYLRLGGLHQLVPSYIGGMWITEPTLRFTKLQELFPVLIELDLSDSEGSSYKTAAWFTESNWFPYTHLTTLKTLTLDIRMHEPANSPWDLIDSCKNLTRVCFLRLEFEDQEEKDVLFQALINLATTSKHLRSLSLLNPSYNKEDDVLGRQSLTFFQKFSFLSELTLRNSKPTDTAVRSIPQDWQELTMLDLFNCQLTGSAISNFSNAPRLRFLNVGCKEPNDDYMDLHFTPLSILQDLEVLVLSGQGVTGEFLHAKYTQSLWSKLHTVAFGPEFSAKNSGYYNSFALLRSRKNFRLMVWIDYTSIEHIVRDRVEHLK